MNLIRNTLLIVLLLQFLGFLYVKFIHKEEKKEIDIGHHPLTLHQNKLVIKKPLPISTEYTDNHNEYLLKIAKVKKIKVITNRVKIAKVETKRIEKPKTKQKPKLIVKVYKKLDKKITLSNKIEKYAKKLLGKKYVWGATGPKCYDCSGFTQKVYRKVAGVKLPRVSYLQAKVGKRISFNKLKQGDMVFFDTEKKRTGRVNHVGIYLRHGNFIHASSGGKKVMITNFNKKRFYKNRFLWGRRVINSSKKIAINKSIKINNRYKN